jgi:hypothetical protein
MDYSYNYQETKRNVEYTVEDLFRCGMKVTMKRGKVIVTTPKGKDISVDIEKTSKFRAWLIRQHKASRYGRLDSVLVTEAVNHVIEAEIIGRAVEE